MLGVGVEKILHILLTASFTVSLITGQQRFGNVPEAHFFNNGYDSDDMNFFGPPTDPFWDQFWDVYNYRGPIQEDTFSRPLSRPPSMPLGRPPSKPIFPNYDYEDQYSRPDYFVPSREPFRPVRKEEPVDQESAYNRYRDYFYRRYGTNFVD